MADNSLPRFKYCLVCDDIREEKSNKTLIVGLYASKIIIKKIPSILPKLCFRICIDATTLHLNKIFNIIVCKPSGKKEGPFIIEITNAIPADEPEGFVNVTFVPFHIDEVGAYDVIAEAEGKEERISRFIVEKITSL
jgi:hypothetical protein